MLPLNPFHLHSAHGSSCSPSVQHWSWKQPHPPGLPGSVPGIVQIASRNEEGLHYSAACPEGAGSKPPPVD